jgi:fluoride exporter
MQFAKILLLMLGGALGTLSRYLLAGATHRYFDSSFPYGTVAVNLLGSFIIGFLWGLWENTTVHPNLRTFSFIGFLGGFTTFSTFALESLNLFRDGEYKLGILNILIQNIGGLLLAILGFILARAIHQLIQH